MEKTEKYTLEQYRVDSARTLPKKESHSLLHMDAGVIGELLGEVVDILKKAVFYGKEVDKAHLQEELGDACFYLVGTRTYFEVPIDEEVENAHQENAINRFKEAIEESMLKSHTKTVEECILGILISSKESIGASSGGKYGTTMAIIKGMCQVFEIDFEETLKKNVEKLKKRFPGEGFDPEAAVNRDIEAEKEAMK